MEEAIRRHPELTDARERLIEYMLMTRRFDDGLSHISYLNSNGKTGPNLELQRARCELGMRDNAKATQTLYNVVGFDNATGQWKSDPGPGAQETDAFVLLAQLLYSGTDGPKRADDVMNQMIAYNPNLAKAYLTRAQFLNTVSRIGGKPEAVKEALPKVKADLDKAFEIAPDDPEVMLAMATMVLAEKDFARSKELLEKARAEHPEKQEVYVLLANLATAQQDLPAGVAILKEGVAKAEIVQTLLPALFDLQLSTRDLTGALMTCDEMTKRELYAAEYVRYARARVKFAQQDFWEARRGGR